MSDFIAMIVIAFLVVAVNILITELVFGRKYDDASSKQKIMIDMISFGVMITLFLVYILLISNI
jgi:NADH:ubiquinone oxidoreductase subunit 6 (subunit J)